MDEQRIEQIERWAKHVRDDPNWKTEHTRFIDAQLHMVQAFWKRMLKMPNGKEKLRKLYKLNNPKAIPRFY
mgnify:CR=1 FL=1